MTLFEAFLLRCAVVLKAVVATKVSKKTLQKLKLRGYLTSLGVAQKGLFKGKMGYVITSDGEAALKEYKKECDSKICRICACISAAAAVASAYYAHQAMLMGQK